LAKLKMVQLQVPSFVGRELDDGFYFITQFEAACERVQLEQVHWVFVFAARLQGTAQEWIQKILGSIPRIQWNEMRTRFLTEFATGGPEKHQDILVSLMHEEPKEGEPYADFCQRVKEKARRAFIDEAILIQNILRALPIEIAQMVANTDYRRVEDLKRHLKKIDGLEIRRKKEAKVKEALKPQASSSSTAPPKPAQINQGGGGGNKPSQGSKPKTETGGSKKAAPATAPVSGGQATATNDNRNGRQPRPELPHMSKMMGQDIYRCRDQGRIFGTIMGTGDLGTFCTRCGETVADAYHPSHDCPQNLDGNCSLCDKPGHVSKACLRHKLGLAVRNTAQ
jgi:hypothetical protein